MALPAYNPDAEQMVDQSIGARPPDQASRFNDLDSRTGKTGDNVTEAVAEFKKGRFTHSHLKQLAFAMGYQIVEGKDSTVLVAKITELRIQNDALLVRATQAESAFASLKQEFDADRRERKPNGKH